MTDNVATIVNGQIHLSRITYNCDLRQGTGDVLPLGVIAEVTLGPVRALGLIARTELDDDEAVLIGNLWRDRLRKPFELLKVEFDWAWANAGAGEALGALSNRHTESLLIASPERTSLRKAFNSAQEILDFARRELRNQRDDEFELMLADLWGQLDSSPTEELAKAA